MKQARRSRQNMPTSQTRSRLNLPLSKSRIKREESSQAVASLSPVRLQLFREAFSFIDQDSNGVIGRDDLKSTCEMLDMKVSDNQLEEMLSQTKGPMNCTTFACMLGSRTSNLDSSDMLLNAFGILDEGQNGKIPIQELCKKLNTVGYERLSKDEITEMLRVAPVDSKGMLHYQEFVNMIRGIVHG